MWTIFWGVITETVLAETVTEAVPFIVPEVAIITLEWFPSTKASRYHYHHSAIELAAGIGILGENEPPHQIRDGAAFIPPARRLSDNSIECSDKIVFEEYEGGSVRDGIYSITQRPSLVAAAEY
jgi:hypothetical protein